MRAKKLDPAIRQQVEVFYDAKLAATEQMIIDEGAILAQLQPAPLASEVSHGLQLQPLWIIRTAAVS